MRKVWKVRMSQSAQQSRVKAFLLKTIVQNGARCT